MTPAMEVMVSPAKKVKGGAGGWRGGRACGSSTWKRKETAEQEAAPGARKQKAEATEPASSFSLFVENPRLQQICS